MKMQLLNVLLASVLLAVSAVGNTQEAQETCDVTTDSMVEQRSCDCLLRMHAEGVATEAAVSTAVEQRSCSCLSSMLEDGGSAEAVVRANIDAGMDLSEATVFAMGCGGEDNRVAIAVAGVRLASSLAQAQTVANSVLATVGQTGEVADAVREAVRMVARDLPQPGVYVDEYTPTGTDVSPAS